MKMFSVSSDEVSQHSRNETTHSSITSAFYDQNSQRIIEEERQLQIHNMHMGVVQEN